MVASHALTERKLQSAALAHRAELSQIILDFARSFDSFAALQECVDPHRIAVGVLRTVSELAETEWAQERGLVAEPIPGMRIQRLPFRSSRGEIGAAGRGPVRGEHNDAVLRRLLGVDDAALQELRERGAILSGKDGRS